MATLHQTRLALLSIVLLCSCGRAPSTTQAAGTREAAAKATVAEPDAHFRKRIRATGIVHAVKVQTIQAPQISGQSGRLTLTTLVANGTRVQKGDVLAEFDRTLQVDNARTAQAKFEDLSHQIEQKRAQNRSESAKRSAEMRQAEADLAKALLQLRRGPLLSEIDRLKAERRAKTAREQVASLTKSHAFREQAEAAALRILELQRDRQKVNLERTQNNLERMVIRAPLAGMVALENVWRSGSMGPAQEGDQVWPGQPLVRIFDPGHMVVVASVSEPDGAILMPSATAKVSLDAYPGIVFTARFEAASPVASAAIGSPVRSFTARFKLDQVDPRLLPDLSAAVDIELPGEARP